MNKLARAATKWTKTCDKRSARLISCIHHTCEDMLYCYVGNTAKQCRLGLFQDSDFAGDLEGSNQHQGESYAFSEVIRSCQKVGCARNKPQFHTVLQKLKSFLLMQVYAWMGFQLLIFGIWLKKGFNIKYEETRRVTPHQTSTQNQTKTPIQHDTLELSNVDFVSTNAKSSPFGALLCIFEDSEAVIKMIIKGRSPLMRHWLFDRINLGPKIQIKYVDTKHQLADIDKGKFHT